jgi:hypothetical protein
MAAAISLTLASEIYDGMKWELMGCLGCHLNFISKGQRMLQVTMAGLASPVQF